MRRELEPLYRYLKTVEREPVTQLILDMEELAKGDYIHSSGTSGAVSVYITEKNESEVSAILASCQASTNNYHMSFCYVDKTMIASVSAVNGAASLTALLFTINEDDSVCVNYLRNSDICALRWKTLKNSSFTAMTLEDGQTVNGIVNVETTFIASPSGYDIVIKCDFKLSRAKPFYIRITTDIGGTKGRVVPESEYKTMEERWRA